MESIRMPTSCIKCHNELNDEEKEIGIPVCQNCIDSLVGSISQKFTDAERRKTGNDVNNFENYILASGRLMGLGDVSIIQASFNLFMGGVTGLEEKKIDMAENIFQESVKFINNELEKIRVKKEISKNPNDPLIKMMDELMKKGNKKGNGDKSKVPEDNKENRFEDDKKEK